MTPQNFVTIRFAHVYKYIRKNAIEIFSFRTKDDLHSWRSELFAKNFLAFRVPNLVQQVSPAEEE
jgi:hypothetical protein